MMRTAALVVILVTLARASAFTFPSSRFMSVMHSTPTLRSEPQRSRVVCELTKIEEKSVQRMTKQYDKLCKTCPTRLQPRVDTITEMLVNIDEAERQEIFANVENRLNGVEVEPKEMVGAVMPTMGDMSEISEDTEGAKPMKMKEEKKMKMGDMEKKRMKLQGKIEKNTRKLEDAKKKLELLASMTNDQPSEQDKDDEKMVMELRAKSEEELEIYRLKAMEKTFKYERKVAECKLKLSMLEEPATAGSC